MLWLRSFVTITDQWFSLLCFWNSIATHKNKAVVITLVLVQFQHLAGRVTEDEVNTFLAKTPHHGSLSRTWLDLWKLVGKGRTFYKRGPIFQNGFKIHAPAHGNTCSLLISRLHMQLSCVPWLSLLVAEENWFETFWNKMNASFQISNRKLDVKKQTKGVSCFGTLKTYVFVKELIELHKGLY